METNRNNALLQRPEIESLLSDYGIDGFSHHSMIDTSHGDEDIRQNYLIDRKYVLRLNSAAVMSEERLEELNGIIDRYNEYGVRAPYFIRGKDGRFLRKCHAMTVYLSEFLDGLIADDFLKEHPERRNALIDERLTFVAKYAQKFKNRNLSRIRSMYSIFDLSPYDEPLGIDEKQDNLNHMVEALRSMGEENLAGLFDRENERIRAKLLRVYHSLPCCVFQGDENFSNLCVDEDGHINGLFDFNMSGTEVNANYLANAAFQGRFFYQDDIFDAHDAQWVYQNVMDSFWAATQIISANYTFEAPELSAYYLYAKLVMISGYVNTAAFESYLREEKYKEQALRLLNLIVSTQLG
ncbi:MAG: hypothetical protein PUB51_04520 [Oscillospiraceae bacterium]|nr:hypothetical protein [Oscillospiraceae bacterium]